MVELVTWIIGGIIVVGVGTLGFKYGRQLDRDKIDMLDVKEIYEMILEFISGGDDGFIDAGDAMVLMQRLEALLQDNIKDDDIELIDADTLKEDE